MKEEKIINQGPSPNPSFTQLMADAREAVNQAKNYLSHNGVELELEKWVTIKRYCDMFEIGDVTVVTNWIRRGVIPPENVRIIEELNGLRLIKAIPYR